MPKLNDHNVPKQAETLLGTTFLVELHKLNKLIMVRLASISILMDFPKALRLHKHWVWFASGDFRIEIKGLQQPADWFLAGGLPGGPLDPDEPFFWTT